VGHITSPLIEKLNKLEDSSVAKINLSWEIFQMAQHTKSNYVSLNTNHDHVKAVKIKIVFSKE
jgi:hypothetical protein